MSSPQIQTHGNWQYTTFGGKQWKRRLGTTEWKKADSPSPSGPPPMELKLVRQEQIAGEPYHQELFLAREGQSGAVFQVKGDALTMHFAHANNVNVLSSQSYKDSYIIARPTEQQAARVRYWATHEARRERQIKPPLGKIVRGGQSGSLDAWWRKGLFSRIG